MIGILWLLVGISLSSAGIFFLLSALNQSTILCLSIAITIGFLKGKFILYKAALKYLKRAELISFDKYDIFTGWAKILGIKSFILIGVMIFLGSLLRHSAIAGNILGTIYLAVGLGLVYADMVFFTSKS